MSKTKYNIEHKFIDTHRVVDPIDVATHQSSILIDGSVASVTLDLAVSNYFIIDLDGSTGTTILLDNIGECQRFEILLLEPIGVVDIIWDDRIIFHEYYNSDSFSEEFKLLPNTRRQMLISFKETEGIDSNYFLAVPSCWFLSPILSCLIIFLIEDQNNNPITDASVTLTGGGYTSETSNTISNIVTFMRSKNKSYNFTASSGSNSTSNTILDTSTIEDYFMITVVINLT